MKCPGCGFSNPEKIEKCSRCGFVLFSHEPVPEWRKEVAQKVRAYGDRKRRLTTPPGPLKEQLADREPAFEPSEEAVTPYQPAPVERPRPVSGFAAGPAAAAKVPVPEPSPAVHPMVEIWSDDLISELGGSGSSGLFLGRRIAALLIDHFILGITFCAILFAASVMLQQGVQVLLQIAWPSALAIFLLIHLLYYVYFYMTSRQTPGQVFLSLELKDPSSMQIPLQKILLRWLAMILLNLLNLLPALSRGNHLLLDDFSGTEIHSLRNKQRKNSEWNIN